MSAGRKPRWWETPEMPGEIGGPVLFMIVLVLSVIGVAVIIGASPAASFWVGPPLAVILYMLWRTWKGQTGMKSVRATLPDGDDTQRSQSMPSSEMEQSEVGVTQELMEYFERKGVGPTDAISLVAWTCGFMAGSVYFSMDPQNPDVQRAVQRIHEVMAKGMEAGWLGQQRKMAGWPDKSQTDIQERDATSVPPQEVGGTAISAQRPNVVFNPRRDFSPNSWPTLTAELSTLLGDLRRTWFGNFHNKLFADKPNPPKMIVDELAGSIEKPIRLLQINAVATRIANDQYLSQDLSQAFISVLLSNEFGAEDMEVRSWGVPPYPRETFDKFILALGGALALYLYGPGFKPDANERIFDFLLLELAARTESLVATYFGHPDTGRDIMRRFETFAQKMYRH